MKSWLQICNCYLSIEKFDELFLTKKSDFLPMWGGGGQDLEFNTLKQLCSTEEDSGLLMSSVYSRCMYWQGERERG